MAAPRITAFLCPRCGSTVRLRGGARIVRCRSCHGRSLLASRPPRPAYYVEPAIGDDDARALAAEFLDRPRHPRGLRGRALFLEPRLFFAPYHQISGRKVGVVRHHASERRRVPVEPADAPSGYGPVPQRRYRIIYEDRPDTRVLVSDVRLMVPAFGGRRWDLAAFDADRARHEAILHPVDTAALQRRGVVLSVTVPAEGAEGGATAAHADTRVIGTQRRTVYFPFWVVPFRYRGARFEVVIAAAGSPRVVWARTPAGGRPGILLTTLAAAAGLLIGLGLRWLVPAVSSAALTPSTLAAATIAGGLVVARHARTRARRRAGGTYTWRGTTARLDR